MKLREQVSLAFAAVAFCLAMPSAADAADDTKCDVSNGLKYCLLEAVSMTGKKYGRNPREASVALQLSFTNQSTAEMSVAFSRAPLLVSIGGVQIEARGRQEDPAGIPRCATNLGIDRCIDRQGATFTTIAPKQTVFVSIRFSDRFDVNELAAIASGQSSLFNGQIIQIGAGKPLVATVSLQGFKVINRMSP